jgi:hypothetical protein
VSTAHRELGLIFGSILNQHASVGGTNDVAGFVHSEVAGSIPHAGRGPASLSNAYTSAPLKTSTAPCGSCPGAFDLNSSQPAPIVLDEVVGKNGPVHTQGHNDDHEKQ